MNSDVIKEIANQLGIAADVAAQNVKALGPQWASMKIALAIPQLVIGLLLIAAAAALAIAIVKRAKRRYLDNPDGNDFNPIDDWQFTALVGGFAALALAVIGFLPFVSALNEIIRYAVAPDVAYLLDLWEMVKQ